MQTQSFYPLIQVEDVEGTARFYEQHLGFTRIFSSDWYVQLRASAQHPFEIALIVHDHDYHSPGRAWSQQECDPELLC